MITESLPVALWFDLLCALHPAAEISGQTAVTVNYLLNLFLCDLWGAVVDLARVAHKCEMCGLQ